VNSLDQYSLGVDNSTSYWYIKSMRLSLEQVESLCEQRNTTTTQMLRDAGVSRNAFYTLARKDAVVPRSLIRIAEFLDVPVSALLDDTGTPTQKIESLLVETNRIVRRHRGVDRDNVRHTLLLLDEKPVERLRRALRRGRSIDIR
jgi:transcriptional regulator with XRE-family HTH domain